MHIAAASDGGKESLTRSGDDNNIVLRKQTGGPLEPEYGDITPTKIYQ
jgi:hypothetical protein